MSILRLLGSKVRIPPAVRAAPPRSLLLIPSESALTGYVRESEFAAGRFASHCPLEFQMPVWDEGQVMVVAFLVRLAQLDSATYERRINVAEPLELRHVQLLAGQKEIDFHLVTERTVRSFRRKNPLVKKAARLVEQVRVRKMWTREEFREAVRRLDTLYPTSPAAWWAARELRK